MHISDILDASAVKVVSEVSSKKRLFQAIGDIVEKTYGLDLDESVAALNAREELGPTGVGNGIALPHARVSGTPCVRGVFLKLESPLQFDAVDAQAVDLIFGLFAPHDAGVDHLKSLALVSRCLRNARLREQLRANNNKSALYALLLDSSHPQIAVGA